ncbi:2-dehydro-3-deoxygalactonokinase [Roseovarius sp. SCSIO 43702]|uniref:2-dehydro-3-deoxygalactonokinase n=1 Tax=Roseovarius sp. SCSIO 43702 TaxID=2823043 RepID=UPI001C739D1D|nr:2-dehydro-3-deoxygalactonokinase [Roseovarius sp. SCSIO 43702]QYX57042.1 2-dehydro-3-deoxygalactonokinase [Roseovarius sp. SCSIO 43702]
MTSSRWIAAGQDDRSGWRECVLDGSELQEDVVLTKPRRGPVSARMIHIGKGEADVPAPVLPASGHVPDLCQVSPHDRLSGWARVEIAGFLRDRPHWDGVICRATGDVTHWVQISADEIVSFQGFSTGRLVTALDGTGSLGEESLNDALSRPEKLAALLRRAEVSKDAAAVTGALIGAELAAARPYWLGQGVAVIGTDWPYRQALAMQGVTAEQVQRNEMRQAGLTVIAERNGF